MSTDPIEPTAWTPERRAALIVSILKGDVSASEASRVYGLPLTTIDDWHGRFLRGAEAALAERPGVPRSPLSRLAADARFRAAALGVGLLWLVLRVLYWNGYYVEDSPGYVTDAIFMATGNYHVRHYVNGLNIGTYLPVAIPLAVFGKSEVALSLWPLFCSLLGVASLAGLTGLLFGRRFGLLAALLYATYPGDVFFSTVVMPDAVQSGCLSLALFLVVLAYAGPVSRKSRMLFAGGVGMGICHLVRANGFILVPVGLCGAVIPSRTWRREPAATVVRNCLTYLAGAALVVLLEGAAYLWSAGDFFLRFRVVGEHYGALDSVGRNGLNVDPRTIPFSIFSPAMWWLRGGWGQINQDQAYHALIFSWALLAVLVGLIALIFLRLKRAEVPAQEIAGFALSVFWLGWPLLYHQFGSQSLVHFVPIHRLSRQLIVYAPGAIATTVAGCALAVRAAHSQRLATRRGAWVAIGIALLCVHLYYNWKAETVAYEAFQRIKHTYARIRDHLPDGVRVIAGDPGDLCFFDFWLNPLGAERVKMVAFANYSRCEEIVEGVVLTQSNPGWEGLGAPAIRETVTRLPCVINPPQSWRLLYDGYPEHVYDVGTGRLPVP